MHLDSRIRPRASATRRQSLGLCLFTASSLLLSAACTDDDDNNSNNNTADSSVPRGDAGLDAATADASSIDSSTGLLDAALTDADTRTPDGAVPGTLAYSLSLLDPDMLALINQLTALGGQPIETLTPAVARMQPTVADAVKARLTALGMSTAPTPVASVVDQTIPGPDGTTLPVRIYKPASATGELPIIVYYHGGGWVIATVDTYDSSARALANGVGAVVVSVEYRKGPEAKFPAAHDDAYAAYLWTVQNAASLGGVPTRVAVAGESAGGNLAATVSIRARAESAQLPVHQLLVYPVASANLNTPSYLEHANAKPLNKAQIVWFTDKYFRTMADGEDPRISLTKANLTGLPPTTIINAEVDVLRTDGETLSAALRTAQVDVVQKTYAGVTHEFFGTGAVVADANVAVADAVVRLKVSLAPKP